MVARQTMSRVHQLALTLMGQFRLLMISASHPAAARSIRRVVREKLSYLGTLSLTELHDSVARLEKEKRAGILIEAGCALGGSALAIASAKAASRPLYLYDVFETIPSPTERDGPDAHQRFEVIASGQATGIKGSEYYGYRKNLLDSVEKSFADFGYPVGENNIHLIKGLFQDTLAVTDPVALAHIDSDWYDSVYVCLQRIVPMLVRGGTLVIDDYNAWSGCRAAVDEYFADKQDLFDFVTKTRLHIVRR
jgi:asparagine synthase (glutamine-hydrolysing)